MSSIVKNFWGILTTYTSVTLLGGKLFLSDYKQHESLIFYFFKATHFRNIRRGWRNVI